MSRPVTIIAAAWLVFAFLIVMTWHVPPLERFVPQVLIHAIYPIDKTNLDPTNQCDEMPETPRTAACSPAGFAGAHLKMAAPADPLWSTLAHRVLLWRFAVIRGPLNPSAGCRWHRRPDARQRLGHRSPGGHCLDRYIVPQPSDLVWDRNAYDPDRKRRSVDPGTDGRFGSRLCENLTDAMIPLLHRGGNDEGFRSRGGSPADDTVTGMP